MRQRAPDGGMSVSHFGSCLGSCLGSWGRGFEGQIHGTCVTLDEANPGQDEEHKPGLNGSLLLARIRLPTGHILCGMTSIGAGIHDMLCFSRRPDFGFGGLVLKINYGIRTQVWQSNSDCYTRIFEAYVSPGTDCVCLKPLNRWLIG
jgi:hypothetical protein